MAPEIQPVRGLENVVVASTRLSAIDGTAGRLSYAGYDIHDLAERATFEEVFYLLWYGDLPKRGRAAAFSARLFAERALSGGRAGARSRYPGRAATAWMRCARWFPALAQLDDRADDISARPGRADRPARWPPRCRR